MRKWLILGLLCVSSGVFAAQSFYCSQSMGYIYIGDSLAHVQEMCGEPQATETQMVPHEEVVQEMTYRRREEDGRMSYLKVDVLGGVIVDLRVDSMHTGSATQFCGPLKIGDSLSTIYQVCGRPFWTTHVRKTMRNVPQLVLTYLDTKKLYFDNFKLIRIVP